jgi:GTP cyclohydrolase FolE2
MSGAARVARYATRRRVSLALTSHSQSRYGVRKGNSDKSSHQIIELIEKLDSDRLEELLKHADRLANPAKLPDGINSRFALPKSPEDNG